MPVNYKDTLNLPQTKFSMKGNLTETEPLRIADWKTKNTYQKMVDKNEGKTSFVMVDGPPYANGDIHVGHVLNKVLKDIVIKFKNMNGFHSPYIPGWDCHGLPIELKVTKRLGDKRKQLSDRELRDLCRAEANLWIDEQRKQFQRLGILGDWDHPYITMAPEYEADEVRVLSRITENGIFYRGEKPVYWSPALQTALAAAEVEYHDHKSPSIFVKFYLEDTSPLGISDKPLAFVIWTTTPWTLPANYGVTLHPDFEYGVFDSGDEYLFFAAELKENIEKETGLTLTEVKRVKPQILERKFLKHPFIDRGSMIIFGDHVLNEASGVVHTAPGHGMDDYIVGQKYGLPVFSPIDEAGRFTAEFPELQGVKIWDANKIIIDKLKNSGHLLQVKEITHSYPHDPRSKTPLIFRSTPQWFIRMDDTNYPLREMALKACESKIKFVPKWGENRMVSMLTNAPDWCLSRQRTWGVPIPVFYCEDCGHPLAKPSVMNRVADVMETTKLGLEAYHSTPVEEFTQGEACEKCQSSKFKKGRDIMDVWFDSGTCHKAVQRRRKGMTYPSDIYLEGSDQHRGWFQTSLLSSIASEGIPPFKGLVTHGFVNDAKGFKMSKSVGNVVDPADVIKKSGAEILRLWVAYEDYGQDVTVGDEMFQRITETYRRFRNTIRFMLGNLGDFDPTKDKVELKDMRALDRFALNRLQELIHDLNKAYDSFDFYKVYHALNNFFTVDLSATYLDAIKDRLYTWKKTGVARRSAQTVIYEMLIQLTTSMAPILTFLAEETFEHIPGPKPESVLLMDFPKGQKQWLDPKIKEDFSELLKLRSEVSKKLEALRKTGEIGANLDAAVVIHAPAALYSIFEKYKNEMLEFFIVSQLQLASANELKIEVQKAKGQKCVRCWTYDEQTGQNQTFPEVCPKCVEALT